MYSPKYDLVLHPRMLTVAVSCMSCGGAMHTGKHEQMPLAFLVLHAILSYHLDLSKVSCSLPLLALQLPVGESRSGFPVDTLPGA